VNKLRYQLKKLQIEEVITMWLKWLFLFVVFSVASAPIGERKVFDTDILKQVFNYDKSSQSIIDVDELTQGCAVPDCIPVIDKPLFSSVTEVDFLKDDDLVLVVEFNGVTKGYPVKVMRVHEILNDDFKGKPLTVTYCTLCATALAFIPIVDGKTVKFNTTGLLHNSNMVMYDDITRSLWNQLTGQAIVGPKSGEQLQREYVAVRSWQQVKASGVNMVILHPTKDSDAEPMLDIYLKYLKSDEVLFPVTRKDERMGQKEKIWGVVIDKQAVAITEDSPLLQSGTHINVKSRNISIKLKSNGLLEVKDADSGEMFNPVQAYWFAWFNFHPDTIDVD
jgi:hypothetical protein